MTTHPPFSFQFRHWFLIPDIHLPSFLQTFYSFKYASSFINAIHTLSIFSGRILFGEEDSGTTLIPLPPDPPYRLTLEQLELARIYLFQNQRIRACLRALLLRWLRRRLRVANDVDLVSGEPPQKRVELVDWSTRTLYQFEAATLFRCCITRLAHNDELFVNAMNPVNPFTNEILTLAQLVSLRTQFDTVGLHHWIWDGFRTTRYRIGRFKTLYEKPLRAHILETAFRTAPAFLNDCIVDFVQFEHDYHLLVAVPVSVIEWGVFHAPEEPYIQLWRRLARRWYEHTTLYQGEGANLVIREIHAQSYELLIDRDAISNLVRLRARRRQNPL